MLSTEDFIAFTSLQRSVFVAPPHCCIKRACLLSSYSARVCTQLQSSSLSPCICVCVCVCDVCVMSSFRRSCLRSLRVTRTNRPQCKTKCCSIKLTSLSRWGSTSKCSTCQPMTSARQVCTVCMSGDVLCVCVCVERERERESRSERERDGEDAVCGSEL